MAHPPKPSVVAAIGMIGLASAMGIGRFAFTPLLPLMQRQGQLDLAQGAWLAAANYLGYLIGALICARWAVPPAAAARGGLIAVAASTLAMGFGGDLVLWWVWRFMAGAASAFVLVGVSAWALQALAAAQRPAWAGAVFAGVGLGMALAGLISLLAGLTEQGPRWAWLLMGGLSALVAMLAWRGLADAPAAIVAALAGPGKTALPPQAWKLIAAYGAFGFGYILPATFLPAMARQRLDDPLRFGAVWPLFGLAAAASTLIAAGLLRDVAARRRWAAAQGLMAVGVLAVALSPSLGALVLCALCVGGTFMVITMAGMQEARFVAGPAAPRLMAAMTAAFAGGQLLGPLTVGPLAGRLQASGDAVPAAASGLACAVLLLGLILLAKRPG